MIRHFCLALAGLAMLVSAPAAASPFLRLQWTEPAFEAALDDSGNAFCADGVRPLRDLGVVRVYGTPSYGGGPRLLATVNASGREGLVDTVSVDREAPWVHWHYYVIPFNQAGHAAPCASNVLYVPGSQVTTVDPSPAPAALELWFDARGRRLPGRPQGSGVFFQAWLVDGKVRPARRVPFINGRPLTGPGGGAQGGNR